MAEGVSTEIVATILVTLTALGGALVWIMQWMATRLSNAVDASTETMSDLVVKISEVIQESQVSHEHIVDTMRGLREEQKEVTLILRSLVDQHRPGHDLCRLTDEDLYRLRELSRKERE